MDDGGDLAKLRVGKGDLQGIVFIVGQELQILLFGGITSLQHVST